MVGNVAHPLVVQILDPIVAFLESLAYLGVKSHICKLPFLDSKIQPIADGLGMGLPLIKVFHPPLFIDFHNYLSTDL